MIDTTTAAELPAGDRWLPKKEAAKHLGITTRQLDRWVAAGRLTKYHVAARTHVRYRLSDLNALLERANTPE